MATTVGAILNRLQSEATKRVSERMAESEALFNVGKVDEVLKSQWKRNDKGELVDEAGNVINDKTTVEVGDFAKCMNAKVEGSLNECAVDPQNPFRSALILQKLGFKVVERNTTLGKLKLVESVKSWRQRNGLKDVATTANTISLQAKEISSNAIFNLENMVKHVNLNPSILNKGWKSPKMVGDDYKPPAKPVPSDAEAPAPTFSWVRMSGGANVEGEVAAINNVIKADSFAIKLGAGLESVQLGGGEKEYALSLDKVDDKAVFALRRAYHDLRARLENSGKRLDDNDRKTIEEELRKFEESHRRLLLSVEYLRAMNDLVEKGLVTKDKVPLSEVLEKQHHLVKRVEDRKRKVMVILSSLGTAVALEAPSPAPLLAPVAVGSELPVPLDDLVVEV
jgi:hypothetical protein